MTGDDEIRAVTEVSQRLSTTVPEVPVEVVSETVHHCHEEFAGRPIRDFVPVLVERMARTSLVSRTATG